MPAFGVEWWKQLFSPAVIKCFELRPELGSVHIVNGEVEHGVDLLDYSVVLKQERAKLREVVA